MDATKCSWAVVAAAVRSAAFFGSVPSARPKMNEPGSEGTSATVPKSTVIPARATSAPRAAKAAEVSATGRLFRVVDAGKVSQGRRETMPPSWSTAISGGRAGSTVSAAVSARSSSSVAGMFPPMRMNPPSPDCI